MSLSLLLVDDHAMFRAGLRSLLQSLHPEAALAEADGCRSALEQMAANPPDLVIMDARLPEIDGIEGTRRVLARHPAVKVIILSGDSDAALILDALQAGALAYVVMENSPEELERAIHAVMAGQGYLSPEVAAAIARYCRENPLAPARSTPPLSDREKRILQLISQGKRSKEMAVQLNVTTKSVEVYRSRLMSKLGCGSPAELTRFAIREGIAAL
jgi:two-component system NarL family response regulator